jgi:hypothetical protein
MEIDADGRQNGNVKDGEEIRRQFFQGIEFEADSTKTKIEDAGAASSLFAEDGVGVCAGHGDALSFAFHGKGCGLRARLKLR